ncbi:immunoglobulin lambda-1 light chain-like [Candoia aspera]|uniref:immunoglobulin lambda-1 light chain-like n=1 Tax=Candoia aspera TaxID=51853 RepID=UPI002FD85DE0
MAWSLVFLALLSYWSGINAQPTLTQTPYMSVSPGQEVKFSCTASNNQNTMYWYQQKVGLCPCYVQYSGISRGDGIPVRFTASVSGNITYLTITSSQAEDEADYCCGMWYSSGNKFHRTGNRVLSVLTRMALILLLFPVLMYCSGVDAQPVLTQSPSQSVSLRNTARLVCSLSQGYENYVVSWYQQKAGQSPRLVLDTAGNRADGIPDRFSGSKSGSDRVLTITDAQGEDEATYYCGADHGSGGKFITPTVIRLQKELRQKPPLRKKKAFPRRGTKELLFCSFNPTMNVPAPPTHFWKAPPELLKDSGPTGLPTELAAKFKGLFWS